MNENLFSNNSDGDEWESHWVGMPEFVQEAKKPFGQITVRFETEADLREFAALIGQKLTPKTKSIWHPHKPHRIQGKKVWKNG